MKKSLLTVPLAAILVAGGVASLYFVWSDAVWQFFYNLRLSISAVTFVGIALCAAFGWQATKQRMATTVYVSPSTQEQLRAAVQHEDARFRQWVALQGGCTLALLWALVFAIPAPTFKRQIVVETRTVVQKVPLMKTVYGGIRVVRKPASYQETFQSCMEDRSGGYIDSCREAASEAAYGKPQVVVQRVRDPYLTIWKECNDFNVHVDSDADRDARMEECRKVALTGATGRL